MNQPIFTVTIDVFPDLSIEHWYQKKENLTPKQQERLNELLRQVEKLRQQSVSPQLTINA